MSKGKTKAIRSFKSSRTALIGKFHSHHWFLKFSTKIEFRSNTVCSFMRVVRKDQLSWSSLEVVYILFLVLCLNRKPCFWALFWIWLSKVAICQNVRQMLPSIGPLSYCVFAGSCRLWRIVDHKPVSPLFCWLHCSEFTKYRLVQKTLNAIWSTS